MRTTRAKVNGIVGDRIALVHPHYDFDDDILEVSPLFAPLVLDEDILRASGKGTVSYCDYMATENLVARELTNPALVAHDVEVMPLSFIWAPGHRLAACNDGQRYDCVTSSHVMEHVPDILGHLIELRSVLREGGRLIFVLPNARGTAEYFRDLSRASDLVEGLFRPKDRTTPGQNWAFFTSLVETGQAMAGRPSSDFKRIHPDEDAVFNAAYCQDAYVDVHCWAFSPDSFRAIFQDLDRLGLSPIEIDTIIPSRSLTPDGDPLEFLVIARRSERFALPEMWQEKYDRIMRP